jgi:L-fuconolactonase
MRIDSHQHFWHYTPKEYGWIGPEMATLRKDRLPGDLAPLLETADLDGTIAVQARQTLEETQWLLELADQQPFIHGVVGWVDLCSPDLRGQLERFSAHPGFRGVRHVVQDEPDDEFMLRQDFVRGVGELRAFDLTYDILIFPRHLPVACKLVEKLPEQRFVLDHIAKPSIKSGVTPHWNANIRRLGALPNAFCKVSGLVTEADWHRWRPADFGPYLEVVFEAFGPERIMFGSDWPVCTVAATYAEVVGIVKDHTDQLSSEEQAQVWGGSARRFYGLDLR